MQSRKKNQESERVGGRIIIQKHETPCLIRVLQWCFLLYAFFLSCYSSFERLKAGRRELLGNTAGRCPPPPPSCTFRVKISARQDWRSIA